MVFRSDDIFLTSSIRSGQIYNFDAFKASHELLKGKIHILSIIAGEIDNHPEMKEYIIANKKDFKFGIHGWLHNDYSKMPKEEIKKELSMAKDKIEKEFGVEVKWFFPPWNRVSETTRKACNEIGLKINENYIIPKQYLQGLRGDVINFHYWSKQEMDYLKLCLKSLHTHQ